MSLPFRPVVLAGALTACLVAPAFAQQTTTVSETKKFEVVAVEGNTLVVRLPEGTREITVANDFRFTVDGQQLSVQQLKPGMAGTATITTTTKSTPVTVTEVKNGTVVQSGAASIIVRTDEGFRMFTQGEVDKRGVKIYRAGRPADVSAFRTGDQLSAVIVTSMPPKVVSQQDVNATLAASGSGAGAGAAAARAPAASSAASSAGSSAGASAASSASAGSSGAATSGRRTLPKTASPLPLLGLFGGLSLFAGAGLTIRRRLTRRQSR
jgi:hypothetical protein